MIVAELLFNEIPDTDSRTETEQIAVHPSTEAVMLAVPLFTAVTKPCSLTVATAVLEEFQLMSPFKVASEGFLMIESVDVAPLKSVKLF